MSCRHPSVWSHCRVDSVPHRCLYLQIPPPNTKPGRLLWGDENSKEYSSSAGVLFAVCRSRTGVVVWRGWVGVEGQRSTAWWMQYILWWRYIKILAHYSHDCFRSVRSNAKTTPKSLCRAVRSGGTFHTLWIWQRCVLDDRGPPAYFPGVNSFFFVSEISGTTRQSFQPG